MSLFTYAGAPLEALARSVQQQPGPVWLIACEGVATAALHAFVNPPYESIRRNAQSGGTRREIEVDAVPFVAQDRYDQILWACDLNFVRGEDSFVRAQWAARPFVWQVYPTEDGAHYVKMAAFLARYTEGLDRAQAAAVAGLWEAWNRPPGGQHEGAAAPSLAEAWAASSGASARGARGAGRAPGGQTTCAQLVDFAETYKIAGFTGANSLTKSDVFGGLRRFSRASGGSVIMVKDPMVVLKAELTTRVAATPPP